MVYFYISAIFFLLFILFLLLGFIFIFIYIFRQSSLSFFKVFFRFAIWGGFSFLFLLVSFYFYLLSR